MLTTINKTHKSDWGCTCISYPKHEGEITIWKGERIGNKKGKQREAVSRDQMDPEVIAAAVSRAKKNVRVKAATIAADHLVTLTYRANIIDYEKVWKDYSNFLRRLKRDGITFPYVAVAEKQKRGAWHIHIAVPGRKPAKLFRYHWRETVGTYQGKPGGNIDIQGPHKLRKKGIFSPGALASYLSKYITKTITGGEIGRRRYRTSLNIKVEKCLRYVGIASSTWGQMHIFRLAFEELLNAPAKTLKEFEEHKLYWLCTWETG
jgi:hypothetical protein